MKKHEWTKKEKLLVALTVTVVALVLGLVGGARYPALVTRDVREFPMDGLVACTPDPTDYGESREYRETTNYRETTRCWGVPVIFWACKTTVSVAESQ